MPSNSPPLVYILALNWNNLGDTLQFLHSCAQLTYPNSQVVVIDNASEDGSLEDLARLHPQVEVICNATNKGFAGGMNIGLARALRGRADFVFVANNDTVVAPDMLDRLVQASCEQQAGVVAPAIYYLDPSDKIWSLGGWRSPANLEIIQADRRLDPRALTGPFAVDYVTGCGMLLSRACLETVGLFDERFFMYYEDNDYCLRAVQAGLKLIVVPQARMWHRVASATGGPGSPGERYHMARASVQFFKKHVHGWRWLVVMPYRTASATKTVLKLLQAGKQRSAYAYVSGLAAGWSK